MARKYKKISIFNNLLQPKSGNSLINIKNQINKSNHTQNKTSYVPINGEIFENSEIKQKNIFNVNINDIQATYNLNITLNIRTVLVRKYIFNFQQDNTDLLINLSVNNSSLSLLDNGSYIKIAVSKTTKNQKFRIFYNDNRYTEYFSFENGNIFNDIIFYWTGKEWKLTFDQTNSNLNNTFNTVWNDNDIIKNQTNNLNEIVNYSTGLTNNLIGNNHVNISNVIAYPSTIGNLNIENIKSNFNNLKKFIKKENIQNNKFISFIDKNYPKNASFKENADFINGEGNKFSIDTNLYEETSIEIELDNPADVFLQHTAVIQETQISNNNDTWSTIVYPETFHKANTPFVIYNFSNQCWEYRGIHKPYIQFADINQLNFDYLISKYNNTVVNYFNKINVNTSAISLRNAKRKWRIFYQKYIINHDPLTSTHTQSLRLNNKINAQNENVYQYQNFLSIPTQQFGFPQSSKFHGFDENILKINKYINKPFIIDRVEFEANVEVKGEISYEDSKVLETPFNISLNFFILNQRKKSKNVINSFRGDQTKYFSNFSNGFFSLSNFNTSKFIMSNISIDQGILDNPAAWDNYIDNKKVYQEFMFQDEYSPYLSTIDNSTGLYLPQGINDNLLNINHKKTFRVFRSNALLDNYAFDEFKSSQLIINTHDGEYTREIITYGNALFYSHFNKRWNGNTFIDIPSTMIKNMNTTIQKNNDLFIDTTPTQNLLDGIYLNNSINTAFQYSNRINIKSVVKAPKEANLNINNHLINNQILIPTSNSSNIKASTDIFYADNSYQTIENKIDENAYSGTRYLERKISGRNQNDSYTSLKADFQSSDIELRNDNVLTNLPTEDLPEPDTAQIYLDKLSVKINSGIKLQNESSPYVLMPSDDLLFCLSTSNLISPNLIKQVVKIKKGKVKFTLHGYIPKNNKMTIDYKNLKDLNTDNLSSNIVGNTFVNDNFSELFEKSQLINCYLDKIFVGNFFNNTRKLNDTSILSTSKIKSGISFIPFVVLENFKMNNWLYDDFDLLLKIKKDVFYNENGENLLNLIDKSKLLTIVRSMKFYKSKNTNDNLFSYFDTYNNNIIPIKSNLKKKYNYKSYGQYYSNFDQRLFTTYVEAFNEDSVRRNIIYVIEQEFINNITGEEITNMNNVQNRNKSKTLELYDSGYKSINQNGDITKWDYEDFLSLKHVAFNDTSFNVNYNN